jgi:ParB-like chromosome segregation protein Spo0J
VSGSARTDVEMVSIDRVTPCPYQPRVNVSVDLVRRMADSMAAGRHQPLIEVEPAPGGDGSYQIIWGEQRWRAARNAGLVEILVRVRPRLGYRERLRTQLEENRLRRDLDAVEEAHAIALHKTVCDICRAEELLTRAGVPFTPLDDRVIGSREEFVPHLGALCALLLEHGVNVVGEGSSRRVGPLALWRETESELGISETVRKARIGLLRLPPELQERLRALPAEHATHISRLESEEDVERVLLSADRMTHSEVRDAVRALRRGDSAEVALHAPDSTDAQLARMVEVSRQLVRLLDNLRPRLDGPLREELLGAVHWLRESLAVFEESGC